MAKIYAYILLDTNEKGIVKTWDECKSKTNKIASRFMSFNNEEDANSWLDAGGNYVSKTKKKEELKPGIYFDSGKKGKSFTKIRLSDEKGEDLIHLLTLEKDKENNRRVHCIGDYINYYSEETENIMTKEYNGNIVGEICNVKSTNNFGELTAFIASCIYVLKCEKDNIKYNKRIMGDSNLVLSYWSKGSFNSKSLDKTTKDLIKIATKLRIKLEEIGVEFLHVHGDINPADLGDHK